METQSGTSPYKCIGSVHFDFHWNKEDLSQRYEGKQDRILVTEQIQALLSSNLFAQIICHIKQSSWTGRTVGVESAHRRDTPTVD